MERSQLVAALVELAEEAGLQVRFVDPRRAPAPDLPSASGTCRVRGAIWVVLSAADPVENQLDVLADALRTHASRLIEERYLPPAVRERVSPARLS